MTFITWSWLWDLTERNRSRVVGLRCSEMNVFLSKQLYGKCAYSWSLIEADFENESNKDFSLPFWFFSASPVYSLFFPYPVLANVRLYYQRGKEYAEGIRSDKHNIELRRMWPDYPGLNIEFKLLYNKYLSISEYVKTDYKYMILLRSLPSLLL